MTMVFDQLIWTRRIYRRPNTEEYTNILSSQLDFNCEVFLLLFRAAFAVFSSSMNLTGWVHRICLHLSQCRWIKKIVWNQEDCVFFSYCRPSGLIKIIILLFCYFALLQFGCVRGVRVFVCVCMYFWLWESVWWMSSLVHMFWIESRSTALKWVEIHLVSIEYIYWKLLMIRKTREEEE